jgi:opacity protein-like surface antigen
MTKFMKVAGLALAMLVLPTVAEAQLQLGARLGYAIPGGYVAQDTPLWQEFAYQIPFQVDVGYRFDQFSLSAYFAYSAGSLAKDFKDNCSTLGATCSGYGMSYGLSGIWNFAPKAGLQPWLGARIGIEYLQEKVELGGASLTQDASAWSYGLQAGLDFALGPITLGPYLAYDTAKFTKAKLDDGTSAVTSDIPSDAQKWHNWTTIGAKAGLTF